MPSTPKVAEWERLRLDLMCEEMAPTDEYPQGRTPAEAAQDADARTLNIFRGMFPGRAMPFAVGSTTMSKRTGELPGGVTTSDGRTWLLAARVEDDRSTFPKADRLTSSELAEIAASYDPHLIHRANVGVPQSNERSGHETLKFGKQMLGQVDAIDFDGYFLWTLVKQNQGRVSKAVADGLTNRSIGVIPSYKEAGGAPYLDHLLVTAETPGITNLGQLEEFFPVDGTNPSASRVGGDPAMKWRTFNDLPAERTTTMATKNENEPEALDLKVLGRTIAAEIGAELRTILKPETPPTHAAKEPPALDETRVRTLVAEALKPVQDENAELKTEVETLRTAHATSIENAKKVAREAVVATYRTAVDAAFVAGKVSAQERTALDAVAANPDTPEAVITGLVDSFKTRTPVVRARRLDPVVGEDGKEVRLDADLMADLQNGADPATVRTIQEIRNEIPGDGPEVEVKRSAALVARFTALESN